MAKKRKISPESEAKEGEPNITEATQTERVVQGLPPNGEQSTVIEPEPEREQMLAGAPIVQGLPVAPAADAQPDTPNGKPGLPEPEPEPEYVQPEYLPDETDTEEEGEEITSFTNKNRKDLTDLEKRIDSSTKEQAEALREIRRRQLWRLEKDEQGSQRYANFEAYCQDRWGHPRQWVTHLTNWLRVVEEGERLGIPVPLTVKAAQGLLFGRLRSAGGLRAVLEEAKEDGVPLERDHLREIVLRRADFNDWSKDSNAGAKPAAKTYAKYKEDLATVKEIANVRSDCSVVDKAKKLDGDFPENLVALCQKEQVLPRPNQLLAVLTGRALEEVVSGLKDLATEAAENEAKKNRLEAQRKEIKEMEEKGGLKRLKEEARTLEKELEAKGVLPKKKKKGTSQQDQAPGDEPATIPMTSAEANKESGEEADEDESSEVRQSLAHALENLDEALAADWPNDAEELNAIFSTARSCESRLAEIVAKLKELGAGTEKPEGISSGND